MNREQALAFIRQNDMNGFLTLKGDESDEQLFEAVDYIRQMGDEQQLYGQQFQPQQKGTQ